MRTPKWAVVMVSVFSLLASLLVSVAGQSQPPARAAEIVAAADLSTFRAGKIISDATFFDSGSMGAGQIQAFLEAQVPTCQAGYTCLRSWRDTSRTVAGDAMCGPYQGASGELASTIVYKVAQACGINPQVILATLQKEQGLVTHTWPSDFRYTIAMGQGCPDTAACDTRYYGFFNQVYGAAWQLKRYANPPGTSQFFTWYAPGSTWNIRYHPNQACGSSPVYVQNQATSNLYYYTPYQPNAASLRAGSGTGDSCSSYGNRNFYRYFSDWFGDPTIDVFGAILLVWKAAGGSGGLLGRAVAPEVCNWDAGAAGCTQAFSSGTVAWSPTGGAHYIAGAINALWTGMRGTIGLPIAGESCQWSGSINCTQQFQNGTIVWTPQRGPISMTGAINALWQPAQGVVGLPVASEKCTWSGEVSCVQEFERGGIVWGPGSGVHYLGAGLYPYWRDVARNVVGLPTGDESCVWTGDANCVQEFQRGALVWSPAGGLRYLGAGLYPYWRDVARNVVGLPTGDESCVWTGDANCVQQFQRGALVWSAAGGLRYLGAGLYPYWRDVARNVVGLPTGDESCVWTGDANCVQQFQRGALVWSAVGGLRYLGAGLYPYWRDVARNIVGLPTGDESCVWTGDVNCVQPFQRGVIVWSALYGVHYVSGPIRQAWSSASPPVGLPTGEEACFWSGDVRCVQRFQTATITWRPSTGAVITRP